MAIVQVSGTIVGVTGRLEAPGLNAPLLLTSPPMRADWRHREILDLVARDSGGAPGGVTVAANHAFFSASNFRYYTVRDGLPSRWSGVWRDRSFNVNYVNLLTSWVVRHFDPTLRWARLSVAIEAAPVRIRPGALVVGR